MKPAVLHKWKGGFGRPFLLLMGRLGRPNLNFQQETHL